MKRNTIIYIVLVIILGVAVYLVVARGKEAKAPVIDTMSPNPPPAVTDLTPPPPPPPTTTTPPPAPAGTKFTSEADITPGADVLVEQILYDGTSFTPNKLTIKSGDIVIFKNQSTQPFWPASGPHPQHTNYPEFDAKKAIPAGGTYEFTFVKVGTWPFHDHLNPSVFGVITVTP